MSNPSGVDEPEAPARAIPSQHNFSDIISFFSNPKVPLKDLPEVLRHFCELDFFPIGRKRHIMGNLYKLWAKGNLQDEAGAGNQIDICPFCGKELYSDSDETTHRQTNRVQERRGPLIPSDGTSRDGIRLFYRRNPILRVFFDHPASTGLIVWLILAAVWLVPAAVFDYLFTAHGTVQPAATSTTMFLLVVALPLVLLLAYNVYQIYWKTFIHLEGRVKDKRAYKMFLLFSHYSMQSRTQHLVVGIALTVVIMILVFLGLRPPAWAAFGFYTDSSQLAARVATYLPIAVVWLVSVYIFITIAWHFVGIVRAMRRFCRLSELELRPLDPDGFAGLRPLASLAFAIDLVVLLAFIGLGFYIYTRRYSGPMLGGILSGADLYLISFGAAMISLGTIILFFLPLATAHEVMERKKYETLSVLGQEHYSIFKAFVASLGTKDLEIKEQEASPITRLEELERIYQQVQKMPVWPFDSSFALRIASLVLVPDAIIIVLNL